MRKMTNNVKQDKRQIKFSNQEKSERQWSELEKTAANVIKETVLQMLQKIKETVLSLHYI